MDDVELHDVGPFPFHGYDTIFDTIMSTPIFILIKVQPKAIRAAAERAAAMGDELGDQ